MAYSASMKEVVSKAHFIGYSDVFYHCKPRTGIRVVITTYCKLVLT